MKIFNPLDGKKYSIFSKIGKKILNKYIRAYKKRGGLFPGNYTPWRPPTIDGITKFISEEVTAIMPAIKTKNLTESKAANPSIPSIKLKAFTTTIKTKIETTYDVHSGIS